MAHDDVAPGLMVDQITKSTESLDGIPCRNRPADGSLSDLCDFLSDRKRNRITVLLPQLIRLSQVKLFDQVLSHRFDVWLFEMNPVGKE